MATATRKRNTAASLIATEFVKYETLSDGSIWDEVKLPEPIEQHPAVETVSEAKNQTASPLIVVLIAFVAVSVMAKLIMGIVLILAKMVQKIAPKVLKFVSAQLGGEKIDFRVYRAIFD